jgi:phosphoribosylaminoimidazole-succinocarboxamide synthase
MPEEIRKYKDQLDGRAMLVRRAQVVPLEAIVRGYLVGELFYCKFSFKSPKFVVNLLGSAWSEYKKYGMVHSIPMPVGIKDGQKLEKPVFTPSTKAEQGEHDENISPEQGENRLIFRVYLSLTLFFQQLRN